SWIVEIASGERAEAEVAGRAIREHAVEIGVRERGERRSRHEPCLVSRKRIREAAGGEVERSGLQTTAQYRHVVDSGRDDGWRALYREHLQPCALVAILQHYGVAVAPQQDEQQLVVAAF